MCLLAFPNESLHPCLRRQMCKASVILTNWVELNSKILCDLSFFPLFCNIINLLFTFYGKILIWNGINFSQFCMSENKLNMLNQKNNAQISQNLAFVLKNVIYLFFISKDWGGHNFSFLIGQVETMRKM